jgi:uncharacterized protein with HEPN domain
MSHHDPLVRVLHMRDYALEAIELLGSKTLEELQEDRTLQLALLQLIEIIGEASTRIGKDFKQQHPSVPWSQAAAMRNRLIHGYDAVNIPIVFNTVRTHLPPLYEQLQELLGSGDIESPPLPPSLAEGGSD